MEQKENIKQNKKLKYGLLVLLLIVMGTGALFFIPRDITPVTHADKEIINPKKIKKAKKAKKVFKAKKQKAPATQPKAVAAKKATPPKKVAASKKVVPKKLAAAKKTTPKAMDPYDGDGNNRAPTFEEFMKGDHSQSY